MRSHMETLGNNFPRRYWIGGVAQAIELAMALACTQQEPPATSQDDAARSQAVQAQAAAEAAQATAARAVVAAQAAAQAPTEAAAVGVSNAEALQAQAAAAQAVAAAEAAAEAARRGEDRPSITVIGSGSGSTGTGSGTGSVSATGTGTGSGTGSGSASGTATAAMMSQKEGGLVIPTGLSYETEGPTASDGCYTATTNREIYAKISTDYQEIAKLTNVIKEGKPFPAAEIWLLYEAGSHTRLGPQSRTLRSFATGSTPSRYYPDSAEFCGSDTLLDDPIENVIRGRREAENYSDAQRRTGRE